IRLAVAGFLNNGAFR
nr:oleosin=20 kda oil-body boundary protein {internal fragment} [Helianthus annuus=sunflowers, cv. Sunbread 236, seeds, cotyledons, Peptide Partial, 15 aa] [Helianthus annuus]